MFRKVLVANRGEIAVRIIRTLREMGVATVAVFSDADRESLHVSMADEAVPLGEPNPGLSYCNEEKLLQAARLTGCDALHPGYGFLSENAHFARAVRDAGLVFIGPSEHSIALLADKTRVKKVLKGEGIPVVPGSLEHIRIEDVVAEVEKVGLPAVVKAVSGGGGRGIRIIKNEADATNLAREAADEAEAMFQDGRVYVERFLERVRHIEVQVVLDAHGQAVHLFDRDCSIQRRFQKVIEESPAVGLDATVREKMASFATLAMKIVGFEGVGTVEFLLERDGKFYFLEANPRLQVEHPVTEMRTGLDLVRLQVEIAAGVPLGFSQEDICPHGHAIECRIYAEDPDREFAPCAGQVLDLKPPGGPGVRFDCGILAGATISCEYDPLIAKVVVLAEDRPKAIARMLRALEETVILGIPTSVEFLMDLMKSQDFLTGNICTSYLEDFFARWESDKALDPWAAVGFRLETLAQRQGCSSCSPQSPWKTLGGFGRK